MKTTAGFTGLLLMATGVAANAGGSDEMWDYTFSMKMNGTLMPTMRQQQCLAKSAAYAPEAPSNCTIGDLHTSSNKSSWTMTCTGDHPMTLKGEATRTADKIEGTMTVLAEGHEMNQVISGKVVGNCDAAEEKRKLEERAKSGQGMDAMMPPMDMPGRPRPNLPVRAPADVAADVDAARAQVPAAAPAPQVPPQVQAVPSAAAQAPADQAEGSGNKLLDAAQKLKKKLGF